MISKLGISVALGLSFSLLATASWSQTRSPGITDDTVFVGTIAPLSGPTAPLSIYNRQIDAYLKYVNEQGGVKMADGKTRQVKMRLIDSGGQPSRAVSAARELIEQDQVFALVGPFGTNENQAIADYVNAKKVPHVYLLSAATAWGVDLKKRPWSIGFPPVPGTQTAIYAAYLKEVKPNAKIAVLHANDEYGKDGLAGMKRAVAGSGMQIVASESYEYTDTTVDSQIVKLAGSGADVFLNFALGRPAVQAIQKASEIGWSPLRLVETSTASSGLLKRLPPATIEGIVSAMYLKDPASDRFKEDAAIKAYQAAMGKFFGPGFDPTAQPMGAAIAEALVKVLRELKSGQRSEFMELVRKVDKQENSFLLPGITFNNASTNGYPITQMQIVTVHDGMLKPVGDIRTGSPR